PTGADGVTGPTGPTGPIISSMEVVSTLQQSSIGPTGAILFQSAQVNNGGTDIAFTGPSTDIMLGAGAVFQVSYTFNGAPSNLPGNMGIALRLNGTEISGSRIAQNNLSGASFFSMTIMIDTRGAGGDQALTLNNSSAIPITTSIFGSTVAAIVTIIRIL
ncbi:hypothetical protein CN602_28575, partial [Bacillus cereus]